MTRSLPACYSPYIAPYLCRAAGRGGLSCVSSSSASRTEALCLGGTFLSLRRRVSALSTLVKPLLRRCSYLAALQQCRNSSGCCASERRASAERARCAAVRPWPNRWMPRPGLAYGAGLDRPRPGPISRRPCRPRRRPHLSCAKRLLPCREIVFSHNTQMFTPHTPGTVRNTLAGCKRPACRCFTVHPMIFAAPAPFDNTPPWPNVSLATRCAYAESLRFTPSSQALRTSDSASRPAHAES